MTHSQVDMSTTTYLFVLGKFEMLAHHIHLHSYSENSTHHAMFYFLTMTQWGKRDPARCRADARLSPTEAS